MLSDKSYAKFFGESLLEEIFHLDEELTQAVATMEDPAVEDELEHSLDVALSEAEVEGTKIINEAVKRKPKFHVSSSFGGARLSAHHTEAAAHKAAAKHSVRQPVDIWSNHGGAFGIGKVVAHYNNGVKSVYEDYETNMDDMMVRELEITESERKRKIFSQPKKQSKQSRRDNWRMTQAQDAWERAKPKTVSEEDDKPKVDWNRANKAAAEFLAGKRKGIPGMRVAKAKDLGLRSKDIKSK